MLGTTDVHSGFCPEDGGKRFFRADSAEENERKPHMTSRGTDSVELRADGSQRLSDGKQMAYVYWLLQRWAASWIAGVRIPARNNILLFSTASRPALGPTQPPTQWVLGG
jgi:hypothetical protein